MKTEISRSPQIVKQNVRFARHHYPDLSAAVLASLRNLSTRLPLLLESGEVTLLDSSWYITHSGLLKIAALKRCAGIVTIVQRKLSDPPSGRWVFKAIVYKSRASRGFIGYGDASPANVSPRVYGSEMRIAETRAVNRALRKAYAIGMCSYEELGTEKNDAGRIPAATAPPEPATLRRRLCMLITRYGLNAGAVKRYAADYCGTEELRGTSRELVEGFIGHLSMALVANREAVLDKLKSYENGGLQ